MEEFGRLTRAAGNPRGRHARSIQIAEQSQSVGSERLLRRPRILLAIWARPGSLMRPVGFLEASRSIHGWFMPASSIASTPRLLRKAQHRVNWRYTDCWAQPDPVSARVNGALLSANWSYDQPPRCRPTGPAQCGRLRANHLERLLPRVDAVEPHFYGPGSAARIRCA